jgi:transposase InsO family protein
VSLAHTLDPVLTLLASIFGALRAALCSRADLALENLALRHQLAILARSTPRPRLRDLDRAVWATLARCWARWRSVLAIVKPETVLAWHRRGFRWFWRRRTRGAGRPSAHAELVDLIRRFARANPTWGARRIRDELRRLGVEVSKDTILKYMPLRPRRPRSGTWMTFLRNHLPSTVAIDFFTVPTATFRVLYGFVVLAHDRRRVLHVNVTEYPSARWAAQQMVEAIGLVGGVRRVLRDRDGIYGCEFVRRVVNLGVEHLLSSPSSPWQNPFVERFIGTLRRELLDHVVVLNERHLLRLLRGYVSYYNADRTHLGLGGDAPARRAIEPPELGEVAALPRVGGLHHRYVRRRAA